MTTPKTAHKKRSTIVAFVLNLVFYPAGYVYTGKTRLGLSIYAALALMSVAAFLFSITFPPGLYAWLSTRGPALGVVFGIAIAVSVHAAHLAKKNLPRLSGGAFWAAIIALPVALYGFSYVAGGAWPYPAYTIPSESGVPTILKGDTIIAKGSKRFCGSINPKLGDIVIYKRGDTSYIKRLVGMPGDRVRLTHGQLFINEQPALQKIEARTDLDLGGFMTKADIVRETLPNGKSYLIALLDRASPPENTAQITLPAGQYFFVGDSRDNSLDSRFDGPTPHDRLCAVAIKVVKSPNPAHIGKAP